MKLKWTSMAVGALALIIAAWPGSWRSAPVSAAPAPGAHVLVIHGQNVGPGADWMAPIARDADQAVRRALQRLNLPFCAATDGEVANGVVDPRKAQAIILPYNRELSPAQINLISQAMDRGVPLISFHVLDARFSKRLGVQTGGFLQLQPGESVTLRPDTVSLVGAPAAVTMSPYFRRSFTVTGEQARVAGWWQGSDVGQPEPAFTLGDQGCYFGFVPRSEDAVMLSALLWPVLGRVAPQVVSPTLPRTARDLGPVGRFASLADLMASWRNRPQGAEPEAWEAAKQAEEALRMVTELVAQGRVPEAEQQATQARDLATRAYWSAYYSPAPEIRGVWAYPWPQSGERSWDQAMARLERGNFNVVFPYVASAGVAYYPSGILPRAAQGDCDYLQAAVTAGRQSGIEVHPRILALQCLFTPKPVLVAMEQAGRLAVDGKGKTTTWLCPTDPRNQEQLLALATEIVLRYPVSGLQLDYFRYEGTDTCVCRRCRAEFEKATGIKTSRWPQDVLSGPTKARFLAWRHEPLTAMLRALRAQLRAVRPEVRLSIATFPNWLTTRDYVGQTPAAWAQDGLVDFLCPMDYTDDHRRFGGYVDEQIKQLAGAVPLAVGIGAFADNCPFGSPQQLADQIEIVRAKRAAGFVIFNYNPRFVADFLPWIELGLTRRPADPIWIQG